MFIKLVKKFQYFLTRLQAALNSEPHKQFIKRFAVLIFNELFQPILSCFYNSQSHLRPNIRPCTYLNISRKTIIFIIVRGPIRTRRG